jgi:hypothetical protein
MKTLHIYKEDQLEDIAEDELSFDGNIEIHCAVYESCMSITCSGDLIFHENACVGAIDITGN